MSFWSISPKKSRLLPVIWWPMNQPRYQPPMPSTTAVRRLNPIRRRNAVNGAPLVSARAPLRVGQVDGRVLGQVLHHRAEVRPLLLDPAREADRKSTRLNSSHVAISY